MTHLFARIRRPWKVFAVDVEDQTCSDFTDRRADIQRVGRRAAFAKLELQEQLMYHEVSIYEVTAYACFHAASDSHSASLWDAVPDEDKADWVPERPREVLAHHHHWRHLLAVGPPAPEPDHSEELDPPASTLWPSTVSWWLFPTMVAFFLS